MDFYIDSDNLYVRGGLFFVFMAIVWLLVLSPAAVAIQKAMREPLRYRRREYMVIAMYIIPPFIGAIVQYAFYMTPLLGIFTVAAC